MTDSMKFGPEWLRNLSTDSSSAGAFGNNSAASGSGNGSAANLGSQNNNHIGTASTNHGMLVASPRNMFPEFRYGREEMLSLFDKNCNMPDILPLYKKICVEKVQIPLALTPSTEDEPPAQSAGTPPQRPIWMQRSPIGFSSSVRGLGRGGSVERGRLRGKSVYHPTFQRTPGMFEEDLRSGLLKSERGWYERNGSGEPVASTSSGVVSAGSSVGPDWNGTPNTSPRREFSNHSRNMENWRRNRNDDGAGEPSTEGWRNSSSSHTFGGLHRWGRSTSWRDDEGGSNIDCPGFPSSNMQRSFSTISTTVPERTSLPGSGGLPKGPLGASGFTNGSKPPGRTLLPGGPPQISKSNQWLSDSSSIRASADGEDNLPEWATDVPLDSGGSFDATGAFHGSVSDDSGDPNTSGDKKIAAEDSCQEVLTSNSGISTGDDAKPLVEKTRDGVLASPLMEKNIQPTPEAPDEYVEIRNENRHPEKLGTISRNNDDYEAVQKTTIASSVVESINKASETVSVSDLGFSAIDSSVASGSKNISLAQPGHRRLSDHMIEAADDMVKKLINDDDSVGDIGKVNTSAFVAGAGAAPTNLAGEGDSLEHSLLSMIKNETVHNQTMPHPAAGTVGGHKGLIMYGGIEQSASQQHLHRFPTANILSSDTALSQGDLWYYRDPQSKVQGPFTALEMTEWYRAGYFNESLLVRRGCDSRFRALGDLIKTCQGNMPFTHSSLLTGVNLDAAALHHKEQCDELKANVTAAAETLTAAIKNLNSVDMLHMLNVRFQMLQDQYVRRHEMLVLAELSKNEGFHRLPPTEREAIVRQKAQMMGLPDYLTSLTNLGNTLAVVNPSVGVHLFNAIAECSKKDSHHMFPQQQMSSNYMDIEEFMLNMQRQQQQQMTRQSQGPFPTSHFDTNIGPEALSGSALLDELNLRMFLGGNSAHSPQPVHHPPKVAPQEFMGASASANSFVSEQQIIAAAAASRSPLMQMWMPSATSNILPSPHSQLPGTQSQGGQWTAGGPLVGIPNVVMSTSATDQANDKIPDSSASPASMWDATTSAAHKQQGNDQASSQEGGNVDQNVSYNDKLSRYDAKADNVLQQVQQMQFLDFEGSVDDDVSQQLALKDGQKDELGESAEKQQQLGANKKTKPAPSAVLAKGKDDFKKVDAEEKRRQKEERKRLQMEEEKRRQQQVELEKRRQMQEEQERQKQIQAQRRKAMLGNGNGNGTAASGGKASKEQQRVQASSIAPWSAQSTASATKTGPGLAEIQKAERRERRADQQRQMELLEKQMRLNAVTAAETNETVLKWNSSPVQVKSIAEIQAEETKRLTTEAQLDVQRRKEHEQAASTVANISGGGTGSGSNIGPGTTLIWGSTGQSNKFWGSGPNATSVTGFWEEPVKYKAALTNASNSSGTFAAAIAGGKTNAAQKQQQAITTVPSSTQLNQQQSNQARNLKKSQTVSVMQSTTSKTAKPAGINQSNASNNTSLLSSKQSSVGNKAQSTQLTVDKKNAGISKSNGNNNNGASGSSATAASKDEFESEFINWCIKSLNNMNAKVDVPTFVTFLRDLESPYEVKDYIRMYLGENKEFNDFAKQFLERRSKYKNLQRAQNAHNDDMCKPAPAITPSSSNDNADNKGKPKKVKKNKMTKLDTRILGFSVTAAEGRINVGDRDYVDAP